MSTHQNFVTHHLKLQAQHTKAMLGVLQGMLAQQQQMQVRQEQQDLFMQRLLLQQEQQIVPGAGVLVPAGGGGGGDAPAGGGGGGDAPAPAVDGDGDGDDDAAPPAGDAQEEVQEPQQATNSQTNNMFDDGFDPDRVVAVVMTAPTARTLENTLQPRGVTLVTIRGCPDSFRHLLQQWQIQRLNLFIAPSARLSFDKNQKNAWTKWVRLYNLLLGSAGFDELKAGVPTFPPDVEPAEINRRMTAAADALDTQRAATSQNMNKFYKALTTTLVRRRRRQYLDL